MLEDTDLDEVGSATASDIVGSDGALVEILETEVLELSFVVHASVAITCRLSCTQCMGALLIFLTCLIIYLLK